MAKEIHAKQADTTLLCSYKQRIERFYREKIRVPEDFKQRILKFLETVPETPRCVHGDLQIGNIITDGERDLWIDVGEFSYGTPEWDLSMLWTMCHNIKPEQADRLFHLTPEMMKAHWDIFFPAYLGTSDPQVVDEATKRLLPYYAAKVPYMFDMAFNAPMPDVAFQQIAKLL